MKGRLTKKKGREGNLMKVLHEFGVELESETHSTDQAVSQRHPLNKERFEGERFKRTSSGRICEIRADVHKQLEERTDCSKSGKRVLISSWNLSFCRRRK